MNKSEKKTLNIKKTLDLAIENHQKNNLKTAEQLYNQIIEFEPDHVESVFLLGSLSIQTKKFDKAKKLLNQVIQIDPNHVGAHSNLGKILEELSVGYFLNDEIVRPSRVAVGRYVESEKKKVKN